MYKWRFEIISPTGNYMRDLSSVQNENVWISEQSNDFEHWFLFSSIHLDSLDNPNDVYERAFKLKMLIDGISFLIHENKNSYSKIVLGKLYNEEGRIVSFHSHIEDSRFNFSLNTEKIDEKFNGNIISHLIHLASHNSFVLNVLLICGQGMDFSHLYQVYDEINTFLKGKAKLETLGIDKKDLNRFTHTVNNFAALGIKARHGSTAEAPPQNPISLQEAQKLITQILGIVLKKYYSLDLPNIKQIKISADDLF